MTFLSVLLAFIFGTIIGSFLNVIIYRADSEESAVKGRSYCPYCHKILSWWELIPILSYFLLRGRCFSCRRRISWQYPIVEFLTGFLFALAVWRFFRLPLINSGLFLAFNLENILIFIGLLFWLYWIFIFAAVSIYDLKKYLILSEVLVPGIILSFLWRIFLGIIIPLKRFFVLPQINLFLGSYSYVFGDYSYFISFVLGIVFSAGLISLLVYLTKEKAMGWGDAIMAIFIGIIFGWPGSIMAIIISFLSGGFVSFMLIALKKKTIKSYLPFAPFLSFGALAIMFFGDIIIEKYLALLF